MLMGLDSPAIGAAKIRGTRDRARCWNGCQMVRSSSSAGPATDGACARSIGEQSAQTGGSDRRRGTWGGMGVPAMTGRSESSLL